MILGIHDELDDSEERRRGGFSPTPHIASAAAPPLLLLLLDVVAADGGSAGVALHREFSPQQVAAAEGHVRFAGARPAKGTGPPLGALGLRRGLTDYSCHHF